MKAKWTQQAIDFMTRAVKVGNTRTVSARSRYRPLAEDLCRHGMLRLEHYSRRVGVIVYSVTELGRQEFSK